MRCSYGVPLATRSVQNLDHSSTDMRTAIPWTTPSDVSVTQRRLPMAEQPRPTNFVLSTGNAMQTAEDIKDVKNLLTKCNISEGKQMVSRLGTETNRVPA